MIRHTGALTPNNAISGTTNILRGVAYSSADDLFVAVGASGTILTSPDGVTWTSRTSGTTQNLQDLTYGGANNLFVVVAASGTILTSTDGITWL